MEPTFEEKLVNDIRNSILADIKKTEFVKVEYGQRKPLPADFINKAWNQVDWDKVLEDVKAGMHQRICNAIVGNMETEIKTDVKSILSIDGVRQRLRAEVYPSIIKILDQPINQ